MLKPITNTKPTENEFFIQNESVYFSSIYENYLLKGVNPKDFYCWNYWGKSSDACFLVGIRLRGHIQYFATSYGESHDKVGRAAILPDGLEVLQSSYYEYENNYWNRYHALQQKGAGVNDPKVPFRLSYEGALNDGCFDNVFFYEAFEIFDNQSIEKSLICENPLVRIFALLDRRVGKRRLLALKNLWSRNCPG